MSDSLKNELYRTLTDLSGAPLREGAASLLNALGYCSQRTAEAGSVGEFLERFMSAKLLTDEQRGLFDRWRDVEIVFQVTGAEIDSATGQTGLFDGPGLEETRIESFLFLAADLEPASYSRTTLSEMTRTVNRLFAMPAIVLFRYRTSPHKSTLTFAVIHRRPRKRDDGRDVLEKVTLIKDIQADSPHRAHVDILAGLAFPRLIQEGVRSFDELHAAWEHALDIEALNKRFYRDLFTWFERAVAECRFPDDGAGEGSTERHVIRLITRLLFIWFLKEKGLVPDDLFDDSFAHQTLNSHASDSTDYYRAVLQNLFFATLNTEIDRRAFSKGTSTNHRDFSRYRYRSLLAEPDAFVETLKQIPFVNGGLFDCLDDFEAAGVGEKRIDAFTDNPVQGRELHVPACMLLDAPNGLFPLLRRYKFTVEENTPLDREVALDPELLGRTFENLLASYNPETRETARKASGSYYTPRQVVDYMVRQALTEALAENSIPADGDTEFWRERLQYLLDHSGAMDDAQELFEDAERQAVVAEIARLKMLDPAVGSGAFPMGILQTLTLALRRLDPDNTLWEEWQKERARARAREAFNTGDHAVRENELREISATFEKYRSSDFGRKLYLIQNGIYGVDIQPVACQIAKLRFFISLAIEQEPDPAAANLGIRPLPNLETRFIAADTLLGMERPKQMELGQTDAVRKLEQELAANREQYFHSGDRTKKLELQGRDARLRNSLAAELKAIGMSVPAAQAIACWDPYDQNARADWFDPEYMFGVTDSFDIVIGNPPYIQLQKDRGRLGKLYASAEYDTFARTGDIYQLFYERGCHLLAQGTGVLAYITSNSWLKAEYGKRLRRWLTEHHTPLLLIEMGKDVFEEAIVDTSVLLARAGNGPHQALPSPVLLARAGNGNTHFPAVDMDGLQDKTFPPTQRHWAEARVEGDRPWMVLSPMERTIMDKMETAGTPLKDWDNSIYRGIQDRLQRRIHCRSGDTG